MDDNADVLLRLREEEWSLIRHYEEQRATVKNFVLLIASVALGFVIQKGLILDSLPVAILLIVLGMYGALTVTKLYERTQYSSTLSGYYTNRLDELYPDIGIGLLRSKAWSAHKMEFRLTSRLHTNHLWFSLHIAIALVGIVLAALILF